jgi:VIT1/CCC1 family predicted Fe2+/Mn2+ transporter
MFVSYIIGGLIPLSSYFVLSVQSALITSVLCTLLGLFALGAITTHYTNVHPAKAGLRLTLMGSLAFIVGLAVGHLASIFK